MTIRRLQSAVRNPDEGHWAADVGVLLPFQATSDMPRSCRPESGICEGQLRPIVRRIGLGDAQQSYDFFTVFECRDQSKQPSTLNFPHTLDQLDQFTFAGKARGDRKIGVHGRFLGRPVFQPRITGADRSIADQWIPPQARNRARQSSTCSGRSSFGTSTK